MKYNTIHVHRIETELKLYVPPIRLDRAIRIGGTLKNGNFEHFLVKSFCLTKPIDLIFDFFLMLCLDSL